MSSFPMPTSMHVPDSLRRAAAADPHAPAIVGETWTVSYAMLHTAACVLATQLAEVAPAGTVAVMMPKSALAVAALHGVLMSGRAYLPIAATLPLPRLTALLREAQVAAVLVDASDPFATGARLPVPLHCIAVDESIFLANATIPPARAITDDTAACVLATAGPGDEAQAAVICHGNLRAHAAAAVGTFRITPQDRVASHATFDSDLHFLDLYAACLARAAVVLVPTQVADDGAALLQFVARRQVTLWHSRASTLPVLAQALQHTERQRLSGLRALLCARERAPTQALLQVLRACPWVRAYNLYGCAETHHSLVHELPRSGELTPPLPIGTALPGMHCLLLGDDGLAVPAGEPGTLWIAGDGLMRGYLDSATDHRVMRTLAGPEGAPRRWFRTGDRAELLRNGALHLIGRADSVVRSQGHRVDLGDIEAQVASHAALAEAGVIALPEGEPQAGYRVVAVVRRARGARVNSVELKVYCARRMPSHMVPQQFHFVDGPLPKNGQGQVDRLALQRRFDTRATPQEP
mgnify:CR=1 FL=1